MHPCAGACVLEVPDRLPGAAMTRREYACSVRRHQLVVDACAISQQELGVARLDPLRDERCPGQPVSSAPKPLANGARLCDI